jgi:hypothetical protein
LDTSEDKPPLQYVCIRYSNFRNVWDTLKHAYVNVGFEAENCPLLGYYAASSGGSLPTFWDKLSVPSLRVKNPQSIHYQYSLRNYPEEASFRLLRVESLKSRLSVRFSQWWFCRLKSSRLLLVD